MTGTDIVVALLMALGLATVVVPVLPGTLLVAAGLLVWASEDGSRTAWIVAVAGLVLLTAGMVVKYVVPGRRLAEAGVPFTTQLAGLALGVVGFFVVPVIGLFLGFVLGVWLAELRRLGRAAAWPSTKHALRAAGLSILIELGFGLLAVLAWVVGLIVTA